MYADAFGGWELGSDHDGSHGQLHLRVQNGLSENTSLTIDGANGGLNSLFNTGIYQRRQRPLVVPGRSARSDKGNTLLNQCAFTLIGYQIGTIMPNMEPRGYCQGSSLLDTDLSIDKNFKLTERFRLAVPSRSVRHVQPPELP